MSLDERFMERAAELEQAERDNLINAARRRAAAEQAPATHCRNCGEPLTAGVPGSYCDADCRDDFTRRQRAHVRSGTPQPLKDTHDDDDR